MEICHFFNGYIPGPAAHDGESEHTMLMRELSYAVHADSYNWKYAWFGEHHALTEYSHMSAPEVTIPWVASRTERIHLGSAIINLSPPVNQPTRNAERVAMLDHVTGGRFEFGTGRGAGEHEMQTFDLHTSETKEMWDEVAPEISHSPFEELGRHRGGAILDPAEGRHIVVPELGVIDDEVDHRGHENRSRDAVLLDRLQPRLAGVDGDGASPLLGRDASRVDVA